MVNNLVNADDKQANQMLNFRNVVANGKSSLDLKEESSWPELNSIKHNRRFQNKINKNTSNGNKDCVLKTTAKNSSDIGSSKGKKLNHDVKIKSDDQVRKFSLEFPKLEKDSSSLVSGSCSNEPSESPVNLTHEKCQENSEDKVKDGESFPNVIQKDKLQTGEKSSDLKCKQKISKKVKTKKINPRNKPINIDVFQALQDSLLKKKQKEREFLPKKRKEIKRLGGNLLDSTQPIRYKGKVRPGKKKRLTMTKKIICQSRKIRLEKTSYTTNMLKLKHEISTLLKLGDLNSESIGLSLEKMSLNDQQEIGAEEAEKIENISKSALAIVHSKKFKMYCKNLPTKELKNNVSKLIISLRKFHDKLYARDEIKAHVKRRYVCGFKETKKFLLCNKIKLLVIATNLEMDQGLPSSCILSDIEQIAAERNVPVVYGALAEEIGYWTLKKRKISILGILDYDGAKETFECVIESLEKATQDYNYLISEIERILTAKIAGDKENEVNLNCIEKEIRDSIISKLSSDWTEKGE